MTRTEKKYVQAVIDRGFMTSMQTGFSGQPWKRAKLEEIELIDSRKGYRLFKLEGWRKYSRAHSWFVSYRYIAGVERGQYWANRVPGNINSISDALEWLTPAEVKKAKGKVIRQGDVFIIEKTKDCKSVLPRRHEWEPETRTLKHPEHDDIVIPFPCKFVPTKQLTAGSGRD